MQDMRDRLAQALGSRNLGLLRLVADAAEHLRMPLYAVGGLPRDLILGRPAHDFDLVVEGDAIELAGWLARSHGGSVIAHRRFGTATWSRVLSSDPTESVTDAAQRVPGLDLITARTEVYPNPAQLHRVQPRTIDSDQLRPDAAT